MPRAVITLPQKAPSIRERLETKVREWEERIDEFASQNPTMDPEAIRGSTAPLRYAAELGRTLLDTGHLDAYQESRRLYKREGDALCPDSFNRAFWTVSDTVGKEYVKTVRAH